MNICVVLFLLFFCRRNGGCASSAGSCGCSQNSSCDICAISSVEEVCRPDCGCESSNTREDDCGCRRTEPVCCNARIRSCEEGCGCQEAVGNTEEGCSWKFAPGNSFSSCSSGCPAGERQDDGCKENRNSCCR